MHLKIQFHRTLPPRQALECSLDGQPIEAVIGDTILTALMTHRRALRDFEFADAHRAGFCLMGACQDCWVHLEDGTRLRACSTVVTPGMRIVTDMGKSCRGQ